MPYADIFWEASEWRHRHFLFWELAEDRKLEALRLHLELAAEVAVFEEDNNDPLCMGFVQAFASGAPSGYIHLFTVAPLGRRFPAMIREYLAVTRMVCLMTIIPKPFRDIIREMCGAGFEVVDVLPAACLIHGQTRRRDGYLMVWHDWNSRAVVA